MFYLNNFKIGCFGLLLSCLTALNCFSQKELRTEDWVYEPQIKTVQFYLNDKQMNFPAISLKAKQDYLTLSFDEMGTELSDFTVEIANCTQNWEVSMLLSLEFYQGLPTSSILQRALSRMTRVPYIHYRFLLENQFLMSGNYLLKVYRNGDPSDLVITRRFIVYEQSVVVQAQAINTQDVAQRQKMQHVAFELYPGGLSIINPYQDIQVTVLQNFRWNTSKSKLNPTFIAPDKIEYRFDAQTDFWGGNEFRKCDIRTFRLKSMTVEAIEDKGNFYQIWQYPDKPRQFNPYFTAKDWNGDYQVFTTDADNATIEADYVNTVFRLQSEKYSTPVYVFGKFSDWNLLPQNKLVWAGNQYQIEIPLKQGIYDYQYAILENNIPNETLIEGSHFETENYYTVLVYYRQPTDRSDKLISYKNINYYDR